MHPSKDIIFSKGKELEGKKIALCVTGSVGCLRSIDICRELMRYGADVYVVMTESAVKLISPDMFEWATGNPVVTELTGKIEHIALAGSHKERCDLILVAPATGNTISKIAAGIDDTPVLSVVTSALGSDIPVMIVPAMHESMYRNLFIKENLEKIKSSNIELIAPKIEEGKAKIACVDEVVETVISKLYIKDAKDLNFLITAGPTIEYIDDIRFITNKSSGKMGVQIAKEVLRRGGNLNLVHGPLDITPPLNDNIIPIETSEEMHNKVTQILKNKKIDIFIGAAAVSDWTINKRYPGKIPSSEELKLNLIPSPKIIEKVKKLSPNTYLVIFKAEYDLTEEELFKKSFDRLKAVNGNLVVANDVSKKDTGFRSDINDVVIIDRKGNMKYKGKEKKSYIGKKLIDIILKENF